jgi:hypothetical protein
MTYFSASLPVGSDEIVTVEYTPSLPGAQAFFKREFSAISKRAEKTFAAIGLPAPITPKT